MAYTNIDDPSAHFQNATWSGSGSTQSITFNGNSDMQPDLVWTKPRGIAFNHALMDSSRGVGSSGKLLSVNLNNQESDINDYVMTLDSDGFSVGAGDAGFNASNDTYVSWCWKANGGTTSTNTDGDINSTVQVNSDAGFSIVQYSPSNNTARTIGHGLGAKPKFIFTRARNRSENWLSYHGAFESTLGGGWWGIDTDAAYNDAANTQGYTSMSTTTFGVGTDFGVNGGYNYCSWVWTEKQGFSKFGKYIGSGNVDGPFVNTGFKPAFVWLKQSDSSGNGWFMFDSARNPFNKSTNGYIRSDENGAEATTSKILDFYSNGFKIIHNDSATNGNNNTYVYMAFAHNPFVTSTGIPTTAF